FAVRVGEERFEGRKVAVNVAQDRDAHGAIVSGAARRMIAAMSTTRGGAIGCTALIVATPGALASAVTGPCQPNIVISQVYGGAETRVRPTPTTSSSCTTPASTLVRRRHPAESRVGRHIMDGSRAGGRRARHSGSYHGAASRPRGGVRDARDDAADVCRLQLDRRRFQSEGHPCPATARCHPCTPRVLTVGA